MPELTSMRTSTISISWDDMSKSVALQRGHAMRCGCSGQLSSHDDALTIRLDDGSGRDRCYFASRPCT
jgi:hypothetical protein